MRLGCGGCLGTLLLLALMAGGTLVVVLATSRAVALPDALPVQGTQEDGTRAQQKIFAIVREAVASRPRSQRVGQDQVLSEAEINAFLSRHVGNVVGVPFDKLAVRLVGDGIVEVFGWMPVRRVLGAEEDSWTSYLPESWKAAVAVVRLRGPLRLETGTSPGQPRALRLEVSETYVGQQRVPVSATEWILGSDGRRLTRLPVPSSVEGVTIERQRAVVRTLS